jgi:hypothetical protein
LKIHEQVATETIDAVRALKRYAAGDCSPDETAKRFPAVELGDGANDWWLLSPSADDQLNAI